jgi:hypothetical protein
MTRLELMKWFCFGVLGAGLLTIAFFDLALISGY